MEPPEVSPIKRALVVIGLFHNYLDNWLPSNIRSVIGNSSSTPSPSAASCFPLLRRNIESRQLQIMQFSQTWSRQSTERPFRQSATGPAQSTRWNNAVIRVSATIGLRYHRDYVFPLKGEKERFNEPRDEEVEGGRRESRTTESREILVFASLKVLFRPSRLSDPTCFSVCVRICENMYVYICISLCTCVVSVWL